MMAPANEGPMAHATLRVTFVTPLAKVHSSGLTTAMTYRLAGGDVHLDERFTREEQRGGQRSVGRCGRRDEKQARRQMRPHHRVQQSNPLSQPRSPQVGHGVQHPCGKEQDGDSRL